MARSAYHGQASRWLPVKRPEIYAAHTLRTLAAEAGINLPAPLLGPAAAGAKPLATVESRPLGPILQSMLKYSTNLTAEITGAAAANIVGARVSTLLDSTAVMGRWASELRSEEHTSELQSRGQ